MICHVTSTLGPASIKPGVLELLIQKSDRLRINTAFTKPDDLVTLLDRVEKVAAKIEKRIPVVLDLQGAKMRIGQYLDTELESGEYQLILAQNSDDPLQIPVPHARLFSALQSGDRLSFNDNRIIAEVIDAATESAKIRVLKGGKLLSFKGINRMDHPVDFFGLEERDQRLIAAAGDRASLELAYSFVHTGQEAEALKGLSQFKRIAKIERPEAMAHLPDISQNFHELWLCRGDMGAQAGLGRLGPLQAEFIDSMEGTELPLILAGQVLEHMSHFPEPTRAEVVQLYQALSRGFSGIVLSDETAVGENVPAVLDFLDQVRDW